MNQKEARRVYVVEQVAHGALTAPQAAEILNLSVRQIRRLKKKYVAEGPGGLAHGNRGRRPAHTFNDDVRELVKQLAQTAYRGASCNHMEELMASHHEIIISAKSIGRILKEAGIPLPHARKGSKKRRTRERMPQFGLLVQMDASPHQWLDDRGPAMSLHGIIDDATGIVLGLKFAPQENSATYMHLLRQVFRDYGLPHGLYTDRHTMFFSPKKDKLSVADELAGRTVALTQIGRALHSLGINHIPARSPQAKGRVERLWNTLQSRLVVEMRIAGITTLEEANAFLPQFTAKHNDLFAVEPADPVSAFREAPSAEAIDRALSIHHERRVTGGSVISYGNALYQLVDQHGQIAPLRNRSTVTVIEDLDGSILALHDGIFYTTRPLPKNKPITPDPDKGTTAQTRPPHVPADDHPWKNGSRVIPIEGLYERHLERDLWESLDNIWDRIYAQR